MKAPVKVNPFSVVLLSDFVNITVFAYHTNISWHIFESAGVTSLGKLVRHSGVQFALQQRQKSKKMCHLMFSVEKFAHVTCICVCWTIIY